VVEVVLALFLVTVVRQIHLHLHVLDLLRFERIEVGVIYPDLPLLTRLNSPPINADGYPIG
jgi:hypothetical protein